MRPVRQLVVATLIAGLAPQAELGAEPRLLHEYIPFIPTQGTTAGGTSAAETGGSLPAAPADGPRPRPREHVLSPAPGRVRGEPLRPDRRTTWQSPPEYQAAFSPSVAPYKRGRAFDTVGADGELRVGSPQRQAVQVLGPVRSAGRSLFWASLLVGLSPDSPTPIPSISPDSRVLKALTEPKVNLRFSRDGAGNLFVEPRQAWRGETRMKLLVDGRQDYFGGALPASIREGDMPRHLRPRLPASLQAPARRVLQTIIEDPDPGKLGPTIRALVDYFRGFQPGPLPPSAPGHSLFLDLALSQRGICRHRAYAFTITAQAAGIPARYVHNEAHAFVEIYLPQRGWRRVDLGGAADTLRVANADDKAAHQPRLADPFRTPPGYQSAGELAAAGLVGPDVPSGDHQAPDNEAGGAAPGLEGPDGRPAPPLPASGSTQAPSQPPMEQSRADDQAFPLPVHEAGASAGRPTLLSLRLSRPEAFRGEQLEASGSLREEAGTAIPAAPIVIALFDGAGELVKLLAHSRSDGRGEYRSSFSLPADLAPGDYLVAASFGGQDGLSPALSDPDLIRALRALGKLP